MRRFWLLFLLAVLGGCNGAPPPPPPPTTTTTSVTPRVDRPIDLRSVRGLTAFGASLLSEEELVALVEHVQALGHNTLRVGAQTDGWCEEETRNVWLRDLGFSEEQLRGPLAQRAASYLPCGPKFGSEEWEANLRQLLDVTSRIEGIWLQLIPTFTHKGDAGGLEHFLAITERVVAFQQAGSPDDSTPYRHVVWEAVNEYIHPISNITHSDVKQLLQRLRGTGLPVGVDRSGGRDQPWEGYYPEDLLPLVDYVAFHPPRNDWGGGECTSKIPGPNRIRRIVGWYDKPVWFDETVCFISDASQEYYGLGRDGRYAKCGQPTENDRKSIVRDYMHNAEAGGAIWFTHMTWGFELRDLGWLPQ